MPSANDNFPPKAFDVCLATTMRRTLAMAGAIILTSDLQTHTRLPEGRYRVLVLCVTYGVLLCMTVRWRRFILPGGVEPWLDVGSALLFPSAGATLSFAYPDLEVRPVFVGLTAFVMVGIVMAASVGREPTVDSRLALMKDVTCLSNPYCGVDRTIDIFMERRRAFHDVDACIPVMFDHGALPEALKIAALTLREREVSALAGQRYRNRQIAIGLEGNL